MKNDNEFYKFLTCIKNYTSNIRKYNITAETEYKTANSAQDTALKMYNKNIDKARAFIIEYCNKHNLDIRIIKDTFHTLTMIDNDFINS